MIRFNLWLYDRISRNAIAQVCGVVIINSFMNFTFWDNVTMSRMAPISHHIAIVQYLSNCVGLRLASACVLEAPSFFTLVWPMLRMFLSEKMRSRVSVYGASQQDRLKDIVPDINILPICLGGLTTDGIAERWLEREVAASRNARQEN